MGFESMFGGGPMLIAMLGLLGALLLIVSVFINNQVAHYSQRDERHKEKQLEYYRNTFSQLGVILLGIGVSLFIFFFQQSYLERQKRHRFSNSSPRSTRCWTTREPISTPRTVGRTEL